jgi:glycerate kinase
MTRRVVVAPDSFKGTASAADNAAAPGRGVGSG